MHSSFLVIYLSKKWIISTISNFMKNGQGVVNRRLENVFQRERVEYF